MHIKIQKKRITKLCGDKGYISKKRFKLKKNKLIALCELRDQVASTR